MRNTLIEKKLQHTLLECEKHQTRIHYALNKIQKFMPLNSKQYQALDDEQVEALDQFLFRFSKLQDTMGQRLFSNILASKEEPVKSLSFLDKLNRLEQLGLMLDKNQWLIIRDIRNKVSHEYEDEPEAMCNALNHIYASYSQLESIFEYIKQTL